MPLGPHSKKKDPAAKEMEGSQNLEAGHKGILSKRDLNQIRSQLQRIHDSTFRWPWTLGGGTELLALMKPGTDDIEGKLFNYLSALNIYSGLLVSGLLGYVLAPASRLEGTNELTGRPNQEIANWQALFAHLNLISSAVMMAFTTYMCLFASLETPTTIQRTVSKAKRLWVYCFITFIQLFLIDVQACLAAILNLDSHWAKVVVGVDVGVVVSLVLFSQELLHGSNGMFPLGTLPWLWVAPLKLLGFVLGDRDVYKRIGRALVAEASGQLGFEGFDNTDPTDADEDSSGTSKRDERSLQQEAELRRFLSSAIPDMSDDRLKNIANSLVMEGLTVDTIVGTIVSGCSNALYMALELPLVEIKRGERLRIISQAVKEAKIYEEVVVT